MKARLMIPPIVEGIYRLLFAVLVACMIMLGIAWLLAGCGWGAAACRTIDVAQQGCAVIKYLGPNGQVTEVPVTNEELQSFARATSMSRAVHKDGGQ